VKGKFDVYATVEFALECRTFVAELPEVAGPWQACPCHDLPIMRASPSTPSPAASSPLQQLLSDWFAANARDLPWRASDRSAWGVLVSEIMLQQTPVVRVVRKWTDWLSRWPSPTSFAQSPASEVLRAWDRLGYQSTGSLRRLRPVSAEPSELSPNNWYLPTMLGP